MLDVAGTNFRSAVARMHTEPLQIDVTPIAQPRGRILHLTGPLVIGNVRAFRAELRKDDEILTVLDLSGVPHMDSTCLGEIVNFHARCQRSNARIVLAAPSPRVADLLRMTRLDTLLTVVPTLEAAQAL